MKYSYWSSAIRPVPQGEELPVPKPPENRTFSNDSSDSDEHHGQQEEENVNFFPTFEASCFSCEPHLLTLRGLNYLVRDFSSSKKEAELLGSTLKARNLLHQDTEICFFRNR